MKKYIAILLAVLLVLPAILFWWPQPASAGSMHIKKIVSVVYDDSGSMADYNKYVYANYAMQAFCGMLNPDDELYITRMQAWKMGGIKYDLSSSGIQKSVDTIKYDFPYPFSGTLFETVTAAFNTLKNSKDTDPNTQYWLVVITDGSFDNSGSTNAAKKTFLNQKMNELAAQKMPNGTYAQINFLAIGTDLVSPDANPGKGIYTYQARTANDIVSEMGSMADQISGRTRLKTGEIQQVDGKTIRVSSAIPLLNIAALTQKTSAKITKVTNSDGTTIPVSRSASIGHSKDSSLSGKAYLLGDSNNVIKAGSYTITFDQNIDINDVVILYEPALEVRPTVTINGKQVSSPLELAQATEGDKISVSYDVYELGTDKKVDSALLPTGTQYAITITEDGKVVAQADAGGQIKDYALKYVDTELKVSMTIPGFNPIVYNIKFHPKEFVLYTLKAENLGSSSVKYDAIGGNHDTRIAFTLMRNGVAVTDPEIVRALSPTVSVTGQGNAGTTQIGSDGRILFQPNAARIPDGCTDQFEVIVTCMLGNGVSASGKYTVVLPQYTIEASISGPAAMDIDEIPQNKTMTLCFRVLKDGVAMTDPEAVKALKPTVTASPEGNSGSVSYAADGTIVYTPNAAKKPADAMGSYRVWVECAITGGATAKTSYEVLLPAYTVQASFQGSAQSVKYDEIFQNKALAIVFTFFKDGVAVTDPAVVQKLNPALTVSPDGNAGTTEFTSDGKLVFTPNQAKAPEGCKDQFDVSVRCDIAGGDNAQLSYTVILPVYTLEAAFGSDAQSVKYDEIASNTDLRIVFTVYKDGVVMTDPVAVKALNPVLTVAPNGNGGTTTVTDDGKIVFVPNAAALPVSHDGKFTVDATCNVQGDISATLTYHVLVAEYKVIAVADEGSIVKTRFYGNTIGASFYITKDGVRMDKQAIGDQFAVYLNKEHKNLKLEITVSDDGVVTVRPYSEQEHKITFANWWVNPWYYCFGLSGKDVVVTFSHAVGYADCVLDVCQETTAYILTNVLLPMVIEVVVAVLLALWILMIVFKPRYIRGAKLCVGELQYVESLNGHVIKDFGSVSLTKFNKIRFPDKNGRLEFRFTAKKVSANGVKIRALFGAAGSIACEMPQPWYSARVKPTDPFLQNLGNVEGMLNYFNNKTSLQIEEFSTKMKIEGEGRQVLNPVAPASARYYMVVPSNMLVIDGREVIGSGLIFVYIKTDN